ncbi:DMT family transporter [Halomonas salipaludis]|uniref:S-adenosylmethionine uptake transporter n=1 Tax=Halomonas salipaludis TaxID=2032625 RepID=A0A2A2ERI5_9GAMM|nr:DMT family transporter [Halomonas salipaludis]PAU74893.1 S-adenosylmethionine uptake transporter [Halomonas salipaludis]
MATPPSLTVQLPGDRPLRGIGFMLAAGLLFVLLDTGVKLLGQDYSPIQVVWARYAGHMLVLGGYLIWLGWPRCRALMHTESLLGQVLRGLLLFGASTFAYLALRDLPLLQVYVVNFSAPLLVTLLAIPLLKERVTLARGAAVVVGFIGVIIAVGPVDWRAQPAALLPFGMTLCFALYQLTTRRFGRHDHPLTSLFYAGLAGALVSSAVVPLFWTPIALGDLPLFLMVGLLGAVSQLALILAMRCAPASLVSPFLYTQIVWASLFGYLVFGDVPLLQVYLGAVLIIGAGIFLATRRT